MSAEVKLGNKVNQHPQNLLAVQAFSAYMVVWSSSVDLVDLDSSKVIHTFTTEPMQSRSLRFVYRGHRNGPAKRGTVSSMTLAYNSSENGDCIIQTYSPGDEYENIWFSTAAGLPARSSCGWDETKQTTRRIANPGTWTPLRNGCIMGVRRIQEAPPDGATRGRIPTFAPSGLRRRGHIQAPHGRPKSNETWEIWVLTRLEQEGNYETKPLLAPDAPATLMISELGPMVKVGYGSAAVGFGNVVKIITLGHEWFDEHVDEDPKNEQSMTSRRRRRAPSKSRAIATVFQEQEGS